MPNEMMRVDFVVKHAVKRSAGRRMRVAIITKKVYAIMHQQN
jgi:hypothetical protein